MLWQPWIPAAAGMWSNKKKSRRNWTFDDANEQIKAAAINKFQANFVKKQQEQWGKKVH